MRASVLNCEYYLQFKDSGEKMLKDKRIRIITGHYGSGKTEFAVNYAVRLADLGRKVSVADMDVVNPYFRSRECEELFKEKHIEILGFLLKEHGMDLPAVSPNVAKALIDTSVDYVVDLGGNSAGARAFASFRKMIHSQECDLLFVVNANRPETSTLEDIMIQVQSIEAVLNMKVTGIVNNTHLIWDTTEKDIEKGEKLAGELSQKIGVPIRYTVVKRDLADRLKGKYSGEIFPVDMYMRKNWM